MNKNLQIVGSTGSAPFINALGVAFSDIPRTQRTVEAPWSTMRWDDGFVPLDGARTLTVQAEGITYTARLPLLANPIVSATTTATTSVLTMAYQLDTTPATSVGLWNEWGGNVRLTGLTRQGASGETAAPDVYLTPAMVTSATATTLTITSTALTAIFNYPATWTSPAATNGYSGAATGMPLGFLVYTPIPNPSCLAQLIHEYFHNGLFASPNPSLSNILVKYMPTFRSGDDLRDSNTYDVFSMEFRANRSVLDGVPPIAIGGDDLRTALGFPDHAIPPPTRANAHVAVTSGSRMGGPVFRPALASADYDGNPDSFATAVQDTMNGQWIGQSSKPRDLVNGADINERTFHIYSWTPASGNIRLVLPSGRYTPVLLASQISLEFGRLAPAATISASALYPDHNFSMKFASANTPFNIWWGAGETNVAPEVFGYSSEASTGGLQYVPVANGRPLPIMMFGQEEIWEGDRIANVVPMQSYSILYNANSARTTLQGGPFRPFQARLVTGTRNLHMALDAEIVPGLRDGPPVYVSYIGAHPPTDPSTVTFSPGIVLPRTSTDSVSRINILVGSNISVDTNSVGNVTVIPTNAGFALNTYLVPPSGSLKSTFFGLPPGPMLGNAGVGAANLGVNFGTFIQGTQIPDVGHPSYALLRFRLGDRNPVSGATVSYDPGTTASTSVAAGGMHFFNAVSINNRTMYTPIEPTQVRDIGVEILNPDHTPYQTHGVNNMIGVDLIGVSQQTGAALM